MPLRTHDFAAVLPGAQPRCISVYQPNHRHRPDNQQESFYYPKRVEELEGSLQQQSLEAAVADFLQPFDALEHDVEYWTKALERQAAFDTPEMFNVFVTARDRK